MLSHSGRIAKVVTIANAGLECDRVTGASPERTLHAPTNLRSSAGQRRHDRSRAGLPACTLGRCIA
jgi:hypothetical protein